METTKETLLVNQWAGDEEEKDDLETAEEEAESLDEVAKEEEAEEAGDDEKDY